MNTATTAIHPVTGRAPGTAPRVAVYRNLHRGAWSIRAEHGPHKGLLIGHASAVALTDCTMRVGRAAENYLDRNRPVELRMERSVDRAHATLAEPVEDAVAPQPPHRRGCRGRGRLPAQSRDQAAQHALA